MNSPVQYASEETCDWLKDQCPVMATILAETGPPRWRSRPGGFAGLARIMIEQQLSVASANAILQRVGEHTRGLDPAHLEGSSEDTLRGLGLSRPKIRYLKTLAEDVRCERFCFSSLRGLTDQLAAERLTALLGVGPWTAAVYLLFCENREDLWPRTDVALLAAHSQAGGDFSRAELKAFDAWAEEAYAPHRGAAAHVLWGYIAHLRGRAPL